MLEYVIFIAVICLWLFITHEEYYLTRWLIVKYIIEPPPNEFNIQMELPFPLWILLIVAHFSFATTATIVWILDILIRGF